MSRSHATYWNPSKVLKREKRLVKRRVRQALKTTDAITKANTMLLRYNGGQGVCERDFRTKGWYGAECSLQDFNDYDILYDWLEEKYPREWNE